MNAFVCYSHKDARWLTRLRIHLKPVERVGNIELWDDTKIRPGENWVDEIDTALSRSTVAILLVSADFLGSEFITSKELPALLQRAKQRSCRVISVIVGPCLFSEIHDLQQFQAVNSPGKPLSKLRRADSEQCLADLAKTILQELQSEVSRPPMKGGEAGRPLPFAGYSEVESIIRGVKLGDWHRAAEAALRIIPRTDPSGHNELFRKLLDYQDCDAEDDRLWSALHTIECCARLAPWLIEHRDIARMAAHSNFSVRSTAASICMDFAHTCPDRMPLDIALSLSVYNEDWYVEAPANAALKAMVRTCPEVLAIYHSRLGSSVAEERAHAANALWEISKKEPKLLDRDKLRDSINRLLELDDREAADVLKRALAAVKKVRRQQHYRYAL